VIIALEQARLNIIELIQIIKDRFGLQVMIGIEIEFYLSRILDEAELIRLANFKIIKERGLSQYELSLEPLYDLILLCDSFYQVQDQIKASLAGYEVIVDFAPKPFANDYGSAAHYNFSLHTMSGDNIFTPIYYHLIESVIATILEMTNPSLYLLTNGSVEAFKRLQPNWMAPINISWGGNNRTTLVRIPDGPDSNKRIEYRLPSVNTPPEYIVLFLLTAIVDGLTNIKKPIERVYGNAADAIYKLELLLQNVTEAKKHFKFGSILAKYI
jgi:glutamine synthetase